jgi:4-diphosphocytidyl-2-C-methyl-D-erythritol kinase
VSAADIVMTAEADGDSRSAFAHDIARAKVNLTLEIQGKRADGYHELESLVAFTRFGDAVTMAAGRPFRLELSGPFASVIEGDNLIQKAAALYAAARGEAGEIAGGPHGDEATLIASAGGAERSAQATGSASRPSGGFRLDKQIPVAAGVGGGSADAAAALRLLAGSPHGAARAALLPLAAQLGADVPVCLLSQPALMAGIGERLMPLATFPCVPIVLVNPRLPLATAAVFRELSAAPLEPGLVPPDPPALADIDDVIAYASARSNDLQAPAQRLLPVIAAVLERLAASPGARLARLSGSGPTCFALFSTQGEAEAAATQIASDAPQWWVKATTLCAAGEVA